MDKKFSQLNFRQILQCRTYLNINYKRIIHALFFSYRIKFSGTKRSDLIVFNTSPIKKRKDYEDYISNFLSECAKERPAGVYTLSYSLSAHRIFSKLLFILRYCRQGHCITDLIQLSQFYDLYNEILKLKFYDLKVVTFCDAHPEDNLISQISMRFLNCKTYTLQHGYYTYSPGSINQEVYKNFISDYMLCWGDTSLDNLVSCGVERSRLISFGCFKNRELITTTGEGILMLLNGKHNSAGNESLLELAKYIAKETEYKVVIKKHPDDLNNYQLINNVTFVDTLEEGIEKSSLAIISESGIFVDFYLSGFPFYILKTSVLKKEFSRLPNAFEFDAIIQALQKECVKRPCEMPSLITFPPKFKEL